VLLIEPVGPLIGLGRLFFRELLQMHNAEYARYPDRLKLRFDSATLLMSVVHIDYIRQDIALDHDMDGCSAFGNSAVRITRNQYRTHRQNDHDHRLS